MSKYLKYFETESAYQNALTKIELPNVSLVNETGKVYYNKAVFNAHAGDIMLYDTSESKRIIVSPADWNLTDYPTATYPVIGVAVMDETVAGVTVMSNFLINNSTGEPTSSDLVQPWQSTSGIDWGLTKYIATDAPNDFNGSKNTNDILAALKAYDEAQGDYNYYNSVGKYVKDYHVTGAEAGSWYIPSAGEAQKLYTNRTVLLASFNKINTASSSAGLSGSVLLPNNYIWTSTEYTAQQGWRLNPSTGGVGNDNKTTSNRYRAFATFKH